MIPRIFVYLFCISFLITCTPSTEKNAFPWKEYGPLKVHENSKIIEHEDGTPFLWLGCTAWGMTEWLSREEVELYLDDRLSKGMNVVQFCLFWGKREDYPTRFTANAPNFYGHKAFLKRNGMPDPLQPAINEGGDAKNPNDYWDHIDFCIEAIKERGMYAAVLPFWGRRYVNASHPNQSLQVFTMDNIFDYGVFLGERYGKEPHIIWVNGGDVGADKGGDFMPQYRLFAEGLAKGVTGSSVKWNQRSKAWNELLMTYHPDGRPMFNSSEWFHLDVWLDFNMIETHISRDKIVAAIRQDLERIPLKPTIFGEGHYEGFSNNDTVKAIHIRRQAYQTFFSGATGHTYGGFFGEQGNGPLFSPSNNWKPLLNMEGAGQLKYLKSFLIEMEWWKWEPASGLIEKGKGEGELEKLAVKVGNQVLIYYPDDSSCKIDVEKTIEKVSWYNTETGKLIEGELDINDEYKLPEKFSDGILILEYTL